MDLFLNAEVINRNHPFSFGRGSGFYLMPYRFLFEGMTIEILNGEIVKEAPSFFYDDKNYLHTAAAIVTLIPGLIIGICIRIGDALFGRHSEDATLVREFYQRYIQLPSALDGISFQDFQENYIQRTQSVLNRIGSDRAIWQNEQFIQEFSGLMEDGYKYMDMYFRELSRDCQGNVQRMRDRMIIQPQNQREPGQNYSYSFFPFTTLYHKARGFAVRLDRAEWAERMGIGIDEPMPLREADRLTEEDNAPYFNPTKPQYRWRQLYNAFCKKVDENGLRTLLEGQEGDRRYSTWSKPDTRKVHTYYAPDTQPT